MGVVAARQRKNQTGEILRRVRAGETPGTSESQGAMRSLRHAICEVGVGATRYV
jgi:hypothetical protein